MANVERAVLYLAERLGPGAKEDVSAMLLDDDVLEELVNAHEDRHANRKATDAEMREFAARLDAQESDAIQARIDSEKDEASRKHDADMAELREFRERAGGTGAIAVNHPAELDAKSTQDVKTSESATSDEYDDLSYTELRSLAKERGVSATGSKSEIITRLQRNE